MAKKKAKKPTHGGKRESAGRKSVHGEPTERFSTRLPESVMAAARLAGGGSATQGLIEIVKQSVQYRLEYGSGEPAALE